MTCDGTSPDWQTDTLPCSINMDSVQLDLVLSGANTATQRIPFEITGTLSKINLLGFGGLSPVVKIGNASENLRNSHVSIGGMLASELTNDGGGNTIVYTCTMDKTSHDVAGVHLRTTLKGFSTNLRVDNDYILEFTASNAAGSSTFSKSTQWIGTGSDDVGVIVTPQTTNLQNTKIVAEYVRPNILIRCDPPVPQNEVVRFAVRVFKATKE